MKRTFIPGSKWLYLKIYTGIPSSDRILIHYLLPFVHSLKKKNIIKEYFFIRYTDPHFHFRLRLKITKLNDYGYIFNTFYRIFNPVIKINLIWKIQCDTYQRELERYNTNSINHIETLFYADSECVLEFIKKFNQFENFNKIRWHFALCSINSFLDSCGYNLQQKKELLEALSESFHKEFYLNSPKSLIQLDKMFRKERQEINNLMSEPQNKWDYILAKRIKNQEKAIIKILEVYDKSSLKILLCDIIHMNINRIFKFKHRMCELVIYHYLAKYFASEIAKLNTPDSKLQ